MSRQKVNIKALRQLAKMHGVQTSYVDMANRRQDASGESLLGVLRALGVELDGLQDATQALLSGRIKLARQVLEPVHVCWVGERTAIGVSLAPGACGRALRCGWLLEDGESWSVDEPWLKLPLRRSTRLDGERIETRGVPVPSNLPTGYHRFYVETGTGRYESFVLCAPRECYRSPGTTRNWGVFAPLYAIHSDRSWGAGDFKDLETLISWVGEQGGRLVGTLPLLPAFLDRPFEPSPYSPVSRLLWNEFYIAVEQVPEFESSTAARRQFNSSAFQLALGRLRRNELVDYRGLMQLKRKVLECLCRTFFAKPSARHGAFARFLRARPEVESYAGFRAVGEKRRKGWHDWPERMQAGDIRFSDFDRSAFDYHQYVQWIAHEQMASLAENSRRVGVDLYLDMPLGVHRDGYDTWQYRNLFGLEASGGAPPDPVFTQGQDWGFSPIHPQRSREQGHRYVANYLRHHLRRARLLRIDHVMGLHRLYWIPRGSPASAGAYVTYPAEELYAILCLESHRHQATIVGENLGTVPREVQSSIKRHGVLEMFVGQYEFRAPPRRVIRPAPARSVASVNTHDMSPFAAWWQGLDILDRFDLGLINKQTCRAEQLERAGIRKALIGLLQANGHLSKTQVTAELVFEAVLAHLSAGNAEWLLVNLEDLWLETRSQNVPGTVTERVNWRRKARFNLNQIPGLKDLTVLIHDVVRLRKGKSRR